MMKPAWHFMFAVCLLTLSSPSNACSIFWDGTQASLRDDAKNAVERSTLIIDGEVVRPFIDQDHLALVRVVHVYKGSAVDFVEVGEGDSCTIRLDRVGERSRMLLTDGPETYLLYYDQSNARYEDRILKSDRRTVWPFVEGAAGSAEVISEGR